MPKAKKESFNLEESLTNLETLVSKMDSGKLSLEESMEYFEQGIKLANLCQKSLSQAEQKVQMLIEESGELLKEPANIES